MTRSRLSTGRSYRVLNRHQFPVTASCHAVIATTALESCRLGNPVGGKYWIRVQNWLTGGRVIDEVDLVAAVVPGTSAGNLTATGPKTVPANTPFDVTLAWNEPGLDAGETWFGLVELGADRKNPANAGSLFVTLKRTS